MAAAQRGRAGRWAVRGQDGRPDPGVHIALAAFHNGPLASASRRGQLRLWSCGHVAVRGDPYRSLGESSNRDAGWAMSGTAASEVLYHTHHHTQRDRERQRQRQRQRQRERERDRERQRRQREIITPGGSPEGYDGVMMVTMCVCVFSLSHLSHPSISLSLIHPSLCLCVSLCVPRGDVRRG